MGTSHDYGEYHRRLMRRFWAYRRDYFRADDDLFDGKWSDASGPCVFTTAAASRNVLVRSQASPEEISDVVSVIPPGQRHLWFRSMSSSQALAQSVFGNLRYHGKLALLNDIAGDDGRPVFVREPAPACKLEFEVDYLGEIRGRKTSIDVRLGDAYMIAVECKLAESEVGPCSRPGLKPSDSSHCNGSYELQKERAARCSLTEIGVPYWTHIPKLFNWSADHDSARCPLRYTYQLVRNVLSACVRPPGEVDPASGHCVLLYDSNNPAFADGGNAMRAWQHTKESLRYPAVLQKCTWQELVGRCRNDPDLKWLCDALGQKYGIV